MNQYSKTLIILSSLCLANFSLAQDSLKSATSVETKASVSDGRKDAITTSTREQLKALFGREYKAGDFSMEYIEFEDNLYSRSKNTEVGDQVELEMALRYQYNRNTYARFRLITDPQDSNLTNKTTNFELVVQHQVGPWRFQVDLDLNTNNDENGSTSIGPDLDSVGTFATYTFSDRFAMSFFPYNFDGVVGNEFNTGNVTTLYYISGSPSTVDTAQANDEQLLTKTIPGFVMTVSPIKGLSLYAGAGLASYQFPTNSEYNVDNNTTLTADSWERREAVGYKAGALFNAPHTFVKFEYATHDKASETGSLLTSAASIYGNYSLGSYIFATEITRSEAGPNAFRVSGDWFEDNTTPYSPVYGDRFGTKHSWLGKSDYAYMLKAGVGLSDDIVPYVSWKYLGEDFIYRQRDSAHMLRTFDDSLSHGGLHRLAVGAHFYNGKYQIVPQVEYFSAQRAVFANSGDLRDDRFNAKLRKTDYLASIIVRYSFGEYRQFRPY